MPIVRGDQIYDVKSGKWMSKKAWESLNNSKTHIRQAFHSGPASRIEKAQADAGETPVTSEVFIHPTLKSPGVKLTYRNRDAAERVMRRVPVKGIRMTDLQGKPVSYQIGKSLFLYVE